MKIQIKTIQGRLIIDEDFVSLADALFKNRANLSEADLSRANLSEANLSRANLINGGMRSDGYRFLAIRDDENIVISAGCRRFSIPDARAHWQATRAGTRLGDESLALVDHLERMAKIAGWLP